MFVLRVALLLAALSMAAGCGRPTDTGTDKTGAQAVKIAVDRSGFYRVTASDLEKAGLAPGALDAGRIQLSEGGQVMPVYVDDGALVFYGEASDDPYTATRVYVLATGTAGSPMVEVSALDNGALAAPAHVVRSSIHLEENNRYIPDAGAAEDDDRWFWQTLEQGKLLALDVSAPGAVSGPATLRLKLWGVSHDPRVQNDHDFELFLNDHSLGTIRWEGQATHLVEAAVPPGSLRAGDNRLVLDNQVPGASSLDIMALDWIELDYPSASEAIDDRLDLFVEPGRLTVAGFSARPLIFAFTDRGVPLLVTDWEYRDRRVHLEVFEASRIVAVGPAGFLVAKEITAIRESDWGNSGNQADLIILTTSSLAPALTPLAEARAQNGISAVVVPVEEIYDEFGHGAESPDVIQAFVRHAYDEWRPPRPRYLLIVGDATTDYRDYLGNAPGNLVPSPMVPVAFGGQTVSDSRLADVDGDLLPDLAVGRWPVDDIKSAENLVRRTLAYENGNPIARVLFAADETEARFAESAERLGKVTAIPGNHNELLVGGTAVEVSEQINEGAWLATYIGHGSVERWGKDDIFHRDALDRLRPVTPPIVLQLTCLTGLFAHPELESLSESMLTHELGPVLLIAATSLTLSEYQEALAAPLLENLQDPRMPRVGDAFLAAQRSLNVDIEGLREIVDTYVLLGDPSARILRPET